MAKTALKHKAEIPPAFDRENIDIRWIPVKKLIVKWTSAQRKERIMTHAKKIAGNFDPDKFGVLTVTQADENGMHHIVDGVHRSTAVDIMWGGEEKVPCQVLPTKDPVRAAEIFLGLQTRRQVTSMDNFRVSVQAGNPDSININKVIRSLGYRVGSGGKVEGAISAVSALRKIYFKYGPEVLKDALSIIQATWGMKSTSVNGTIIVGYGLLVGNHYKALNYARVKDVMHKKFANPELLLQLIKGVKELKGGSSTELLYQTLVEHYNRGLKAGHLKAE